MAKIKKIKPDRAWAKLMSSGRPKGFYCQLGGEEEHGPFTEMKDALVRLHELQVARDERVKAELEAKKNVD